MVPCSLMRFLAAATAAFSAVLSPGCRPRSIRSWRRQDTPVSGHAEAVQLEAPAGDQLLEGLGLAIGNNPPAAQHMGDSTLRSKSHGVYSHGVPVDPAVA